MNQIVLTPGQEHKYQGTYLIIDSKMLAITEPIKLTKNIFRAIWIKADKTFVELTAEDFKLYQPKWHDFVDKECNDFAFSTSDKKIRYVERNSMPEEVVEFLDEVIKERVVDEDDEEDGDD